MNPMKCLKFEVPKVPKVMVLFWLDKSFNFRHFEL